MATGRNSPTRFSDGARYDAMMGGWSRALGELFIDWLHPAASLDWIDVGCGTGAFTALIVDKCAPKSVLGVDPSEEQLSFARTRGLGPIAQFEVGDAMSLSAADVSYDAAIAALVVHFMPDTSKGIGEMARVTRPGGFVASYVWNLAGGGFPYDALHQAMRSEGLRVPDPVHPEASDALELERLWNSARLVSIEHRQFEVSQSYQSLDHYWEVATSAPRITAGLAGAPDDLVARIRDRLRDLLEPGADGRISVSAQANAVSGRVRRNR